MQTLPATRQPKPQLQHAPPVGAERTLAEAFATFAQAAGSLESSYAQLQAEVAKLRGELEETNRDLARSLAENQRFRIFLSRILEGLPCGVLVLDADGEVRIANPEARRLLGLPSGDAALTAGTSCQRILHLLVERGQGSPAETEWRCETAEGVRNLAVRHAEMPGDGGRANNEVILIVRDKTEEKLLAAEREKAQRSHALAEMAMLLAHEIRNPLASLELFAGLLAEGTGKRSAARPWIDHLQAGLRALSATVNNVLQFHSDPPVAAAPTDVVRLLRETVSFLQPLARQRQMSVEVETEFDQRILPVDRHRLQQVFLNLALNAFRAMKAGGVLKLTCRSRADARGVSIGFEDQGTGIAPENLARVFDAGFTTTPGSPGLGLAVCQRVIAQHGGRIRVESAPGRGSKFALDLPASGGQE